MICFNEKINWDGFYSSMHNNYVRETTGWLLNYQLYKTLFQLQFATHHWVSFKCYFEPKPIRTHQNKQVTVIFGQILFIWEVNEKINCSCLKNLTYSEGHIGTRVRLFKVSQFRSLILEILNLISLLRLKTISSAILIFWGYNTEMQKKISIVLPV